MVAVFDDARLVTLARELTKKFENIVTLPLHDAPAWLAADDNHRRGEFVLIVHPPATAVAIDGEARRVLDILLGALPPTLAAKLASQITGRSKAELYEMSLALKPKIKTTMTDTLTITRPDDWHLHLRDGAAMPAVLPDTARVSAAPSSCPT